MNIRVLVRSSSPFFRLQSRGPFVSSFSSSSSKDTSPVSKQEEGLSEAEKKVIDGRAFFDLSPADQREVVRVRNEREIAEIRARREELDQVSHHVPGFSNMSLPERLKVEKGLKAPLDVKAYLELVGFDLRRNDLAAFHPQIGPAAKVTPYGRNFFFPFAWGVCLVSQIGFMPDLSVFVAGGLAALAMRIASTAGVAAYKDSEVKNFDETKFFRIPKQNLVMTSVLGTSVATAAVGLVVNPWYTCLLIPVSAGLTWKFPQYAPLTAAAGAILGSFTGPYLETVPWEKVLPVQASVLAGAACSHYVFHTEGGKATIAALGVASMGSAAIFAGMHKMFYPFFSMASLHIVGTALQNHHVRSSYNGRRVRSAWFKEIPPGGQQAIFGFFMLVALLLGRGYSHRVGLVIRDRDTDKMLDIDSRKVVGLVGLS